MSEEIWTVEVTSVWHCSHPFEFDSEKEAEEFYDAAERGDLEEILKYGDIRPDHTAELYDYGAREIREGL